AFVLLVGFLVDNIVLKIMPLIKNPVLNYLSNLFTNLIPVLIITMVSISLFLLNKKKREWILPLGLSIVFSYLITYILKFITARPRPLGIIKIMPLTNFVDYSFPSSHAAVAFAALPILNKTYPKLKLLWILSACFVAFSRIYIGVHYLSDVVAGSLIGYLTSLFIIKLKERKWKLTGLR
ncbi:MAG: phosphatase PAP2 family protein, partial [Nanoarchaeota archaeon]|nr:phosphatase PAP2 family protein [Nanoarchaeota archaeon]